MTKKISLKEAKQAATPGKLYVHQCPDTKRQFLCVVGLDNNVAEVFDHVGKPKANAVLLAHCWNTHDELVEALEDMVLTHSNPQEPNVAYRSVDRAKDVLAKARGVEIS